MRRYTLIVPLVLGLLAVGHVASFANDGQRPARTDMRERTSARFQQWLGLTDDQAQQVKTIRAKNAETGKQIGPSLRQAEKDLRKLALTGADPATIQAKEAEIQQLTGQMLQLRVKTLQEIAPLLTDEQKQKLAQAPMGPHWHHRRGPTQTPTS
jgi:Spy/CpxP family protein refolding chaperone